MNIKETENFLTLLSDDESLGYYITMMYRGKYVKDLDLRSWFPSSYSLANDFVKKSKILAWIERNKHLGINTKLLRKDQVYDYLPLEGLCFYLNPNPMKNLDVTKQIGKTFVEYGFNLPENTKINIMSELTSAISKTKTVSHFKHYDFDFIGELTQIEKNDCLLRLRNNLISFLGENSFHIVKTRGGFHVLVSYKKIPLDCAKTWFKDIQNIYVPNLKMDTTAGKELLLPIPGTPQGNEFFVELS